MNRASYVVLLPVDALIKLTRLGGYTVMDLSPKTAPTE